MTVEISRDPRAWANVIKRIVWQVFYRQLGIVALPAGIEITSQAIDILCKEEKMGEWKWLLTNRALVWYNVPIDSAAKIHVYVFGGKKRQKNTVFVRQGFWRMYFLEIGLRLFNETIIGRILAKI